MSASFTPKDELEEYLWLIFHNAENLPDEDWNTPSEKVRENIFQTLFQEKQADKKTSFNNSIRLIKISKKS